MQVDITTEKRAELERVNTAVNARIAWQTDLAHYGLVEVWAVIAGKGYGDCDDYALTKADALRKLGWPLEVLNFALCTTETGEGHLVLVVSTSEGALVLDNRTDVIWRWEQTRYVWRQITVDGSLKHWENIA